ncbi:MAG: hypothetical protein DRJ08_05785 [Acidobacteria bacterium]|nr:MAG: hypothetical protein DRJ08_05785 [Acidobacteriota bacterium]
MKKVILLVVVAAVTMMFQVGCSEKSSALKKDEIVNWKQKLLEIRAKTDAEFKNDTLSPMAGIARLNLKTGKDAFLVPGDNGVEVADKGENAVLMFSSTDGKWAWNRLKENVIVELNGKPVDGAVVEDEMQFHLGRYTLQAYKARDYLVLLVFDRERPELKAFQHLRYFDPNPDLVLTAKVERIEKPDKITMLTSRNLEKTYYRYAILHFNVNGEPCRLTAYKMNLKGKYDDELFIPFRDGTSGRESYGAGRFLELKETPGATMRLDFNLAFNPLCNYSPAYNCPIPPAENTLNVPIRAGEKAYPHEKKDKAK